MSIIDQRKADKRRRILRAALELFTERGFHGAAVPDVADAAGVGPGTIYRFFASKEELVNVLFRETKARLGEALMLGDDPERPPRERFLGLWDRLYVFAETDPVALHFLELQDHAPYLDATSRAVEHGVLLPIVERVIAMQANGALRRDLRPDVLIAFAWGGFVGLLKAQRAGYLRLDPALVRGAAESWWRAVVSESTRDDARETTSTSRLESAPRARTTAKKATPASKVTTSKSSASKATSPKSSGAKAPVSKRRRVGATPRPRVKR